MLAAMPFARSAPVHLVEEPPVQITAVASNVFLVDFGRVAFGNLQVTPPVNAAGKSITVHFGEALADGRIDRKPPGSVRYAQAEASLDGDKPLVVAPAADERNTKQPAAVLTPPEFGVLLPFRWVEIEGWPGELRPENLQRRAAFDSTWNDECGGVSFLRRNAQPHLGTLPLFDQGDDFCRHLCGWRPRAAGLRRRCLS